MIGRCGERGSGISVLAARHDDDDIYIYIYIKVKLVTVVEGTPKVLFSIATTPRFRGEHYSIPWTLPLIRTL